MRGAIPLLPNAPSWRGARLKHRDNFSYFTDYCVAWISSIKYISNSRQNKGDKYDAGLFTEGRTPQNK
jgi:hypothetical protein